MKLKELAAVQNVDWKLIVILSALIGGGSGGLAVVFSLLPPSLWIQPLPYFPIFDLLLLCAGVFLVGMQFGMRGERQTIKDR